ncbi:hypothetical protein D2Q93_15585 [Alicyclobacillaceae bacterium I2511]|nr:hypothetical protein D2Q93_15585 [Alicyclobacillaceae bacterium I2511]
MENTQFSLGSLLIVMLLALVVPVAVSRIQAFRIPIVVGEILVGIVVGKSGLNWVVQSQWLQFLQFFGLAYLMFVSGLEIDFAVLRPAPGGAPGFRRWMRNAPTFATLAAGITFALSLAFSLWLQRGGIVRSPLLFALIMTTTSLTVVVPVLKEYDMLSSAYGQLLLSAAVIADFFTMLLISVAASLYKGGLSANVLLVFVLGVALILAYLVLRRLSGLHAVFRSLAHGTAQLGVRGALALMVVFLVLSQALGVQVILGTFLAGVLVALLSPNKRTDMQNKLDAIGFGFLIPIFFIMVGVDFNFQSLLHDPKALLLFPLLFVATYLFKGLPALLLRFSYPWRETWAGALLLTTQMSVTVAATEVGLSIGAISTGVGTAIILVAMLTSVLSPIGFGKLLPPKKAALRHQVLVLGNTKEAGLVVEQLRHTDESWRWITQPGIGAQAGASPQPEVNLELEVGIRDEAKAVFVDLGGDGENHRLAAALHAAGVPGVICVQRNPQTFVESREISPFVVVHPQLSFPQFIGLLIQNPLSEQVLKSPDHPVMEQVLIHRRSWAGKKLADVSLPGNLLVLSMVRDGAQWVPHGDTNFELGDRVIVAGSQEEIAAFRKLAERQPRQGS